MEISRALVVDDSRLARVALSKLLNRRGLEVDTADCGTDALEYLSQTLPDVVFIDYMMPDMDGFQAAEAVRRLPGGDVLPMVMYTSQDTPEDRQRARELGISGFLVKPTSDEGLDAVLAELRSGVSAETTGEPAQDDFDREEAQDALSEVAEPLDEHAEAASPPAGDETSAEGALSAWQVRGIAEEVSRAKQDQAEKRWLQHLEQNDRRWEGRLEQIQRQARDAAVDAARHIAHAAAESAEAAAREASAQAERAAREVAESAAREVQAEQPVPEPDTAALEQIARAAADDVARQLVERALAELPQPQEQDLEAATHEALDSALQQLGEQAVFREQVMAAVNEHAVPLLKNRLESWVEERARKAALAAVDDSVEQRLETVVREAVAASAEAAADESARLYRRWRMLWLGTTVVLAVGIGLALAIAV